MGITLRDDIATYCDIRAFLRRFARRKTDLQLVQCHSCTQSSMISSLSTDTVEDRRNELIKVRNSKLLCKEEATLTENEKIIRRSLEKVNSWLKELPTNFEAIVTQQQEPRTPGRPISHYLKNHRV